MGLNIFAVDSTKTIRSRRPHRSQMAIGHGYGLSLIAVGTTTTMQWTLCRGFVKQILTATRRFRSIQDGKDRTRLSVRKYLTVSISSISTSYWLITSI